MYGKFERLVRGGLGFRSSGPKLCGCAVLQDEKKKYLKQAVEKLQHALTLNADSRTHEGELTVFALVLFLFVFTEFGYMFINITRNLTAFHIMLIGQRAVL